MSETTVTAHLIELLRKYAKADGTATTVVIHRHTLEVAAAALAAAEQRAKMLETAYAAAIAYIDVSVCDCDTTAESRQALQAFDALRDSIDAARKEAP